ncbi:unnamed protein product [Caenorhabditis auriculariae]|uniref:Uncharacterized protein n=1 Tax=Caenorhabditis auriculariae TaxID=2777116 RepID=A0A8S1GYI6_9PELO|nr:unnamed protein product [Caenorhabditis auriculariae]
MSASFPLLLLLLFGPIFCLGHPRLLGDPARFSQLKSSNYTWQTKFLDVPLDHFAFTTNRTFPLRYFINTDSYKAGGPILFYTGNEGSLESFAENTGFMWDLAPKLNASVVFAEHRFYGESKPFKNESYSKIEYLGYLTSEQALADFVDVIWHLKNKELQGASKSKVVAFGGSYGGMLSAWIRLKYPHIVNGAIAASAPVFWFIESKIPEDIYDKIVSRTFNTSGCNWKAVEKSWMVLDSLAKQAQGLDYLNKLFKLDSKSLLKTSEDVNFLKQYIREAMEAMAMVDYPYPTSFLSPLPAWPVRAACKFFTKVPNTDVKSAEQLYQVVNLYYNFTGDKATFCADASKCESAFAALGDPLGWPFQTCTEMVMPLCGSGSPNDFFWRDCPFTVEKYGDYCEQTFGKIGYKRSMMRPLFATQNYGANSFPTASNIVFTNGYLDPWSGGGYTEKTHGSVVTILLKRGAHHYDLRGEHPDDTEEVRRVRQREESAIRMWIA